MRKCFVISPIGQENSDTRKHADNVFKYLIKPAMDKMQIEVFRSDHLETPGRITQQMFDAIFSSDICVAVLTNHNPNVFYELAIAQSARKPVIILIQKGELLPFDVKDLRCVYYDLEIASYEEGTHINSVVNFVKFFENNNWQTEDILKDYRKLINRNDAEPKFFETSGEYGKESDWVRLLQDADSYFNIMGIALNSWKKTKDFRKSIIDKATKGCKIKILLMHEENPILEQLIYPDSDDMHYENIIVDIRQNFIFFTNMANDNNNIEVRKIKKGIPHFFMTQNEKKAIIIQYLSSETWGAGPLWECPANTKIFNVVYNEFERLWSKGL